MRTLSCYRYWTTRDPISTYAARLEAASVIESGELERLQTEAKTTVDAEAQRVIDAPWPDTAVAVSVFTSEPPRIRIEPLREDARLAVDLDPGLPDLVPGLPFDSDGRTFLDAIMLGLGDVLRADPRVFIYGQDVDGRYGNAFLLLRPLLDEFGDRIINSPLAEGAVLGVCVGAALAGRRPIGEMQFNDFVATGFNQLVNNAAKIRYRWNASVPMVVRMPWGGLRHAGPYHSQNTEPWFYRTPGLKIAVPSTPEDARAMVAGAVADPDPVLFYEHIALYRGPRIKQGLPDEPPAPLPLGSAALRRQGDDLAIISYGAYVHVALQVAESLAADGIESAVLDLRSLAPLDRKAVLDVSRHCPRQVIEGDRDTLAVIHRCHEHHQKEGRQHPPLGRAKPEVKDDDANRDRDAVADDPKPPDVTWIAKVDEPTGAALLVHREPLLRKQRPPATVRTSPSQFSPADRRDLRPHSLSHAPIPWCFREISVVLP